MGIEKQITLASYDGADFVLFGGRKYPIDQVTGIRLNEKGEITWISIDTLKSIGEVKCWCPKCKWQGKVYDCEPDVDGDGSLGCPRCGTVVKHEAV